MHPHLTGNMIFSLNNYMYKNNRIRCEDLIRLKCYNIIKSFDMIKDIVLYHHERYDGKG